MDKAQTFILRPAIDPQQQREALAQCLSKITKLAASGLEDVFRHPGSEMHFFYLSTIADGLREIQALYFPLLECCWPSQTLPWANDSAFMINPNLSDGQRLNDLTKRIYQAESLTKIASEELFIDNYSDDQMNFLGVLYQLANKIRQLHEELVQVVSEEFFQQLFREPALVH